MKTSAPQLDRTSDVILTQLIKGKGSTLVENFIEFCTTLSVFAKMNKYAQKYRKYGLLIEL